MSFFFAATGTHITQEECQRRVQDEVQMCRESMMRGRKMKGEKKQVVKRYHRKEADKIRWPPRFLGMF
jgi:hypothetical protein